MKASMAWSCCSLIRKFRPVKWAFGARRFSARSWRRSKRDASQPSTKARGRPSKIQAKSNSMDHGQLRRAAGSRCRCDNGALRGGGGAAVAPPARHHAQYAPCQPCREGRQHHQHQRRAPLGAKEEMHGGVLLVVQRKGEERKKKGCLEQPQEVFHRSPFIGLSSAGAILDEPVLMVGDLSQRLVAPGAHHERNLGAAAVPGRVFDAVEYLAQFLAPTVVQHAKV